MRNQGVNKLMAKVLVFSLLIYFYAGAESISSEVEDAEDEGEALAAELVRTLQDQAGPVKMMQFFDSLTDRFSNIHQRMGNLETKVSMVEYGQEEFKNEILSRMDCLEKFVKDGQEELKEEILSDVGQIINAFAIAGARGHQQLQEEISLISDAFTSTITNIPQNPFRTSTDCGGNLELTRGAPSTIRYENLGNNQSCVWKIVPYANFTSHRIKFQSLGTETRVEEVRVNYWDSGAKLQSQTVPELQSWIPIPAPYVVITFCPKSDNVSSGFEASIRGVGTLEDSPNFKPSWFGNSTATFDFSVSNDFTECMATERPLQTSTDCGGNLELARGFPSIINYENLGNNQSCIWTIDAKVNFASYGIKFQSLGTGVVSINYWDSGAKLQSQKVTELQTWIPIHAPHVLITFCPNPSEASLGLEASILGFGSSENFANFEPMWFGNSTETFDFTVSENFVNCIGTEIPLMKSTDCGGILEVNRGRPSTIRYSNEGSNASCVWKISSEVNFDSYRVKVQSRGTETVAHGLSIYYGNSIAELQAQKITEFGSWIPIPPPYVLITFYSNSSKVRSSFETSILGLETSEDVANFKPMGMENSTEIFDVDTLLDHIGSLPPLMNSTDCGGILKVSRSLPSTVRYPNEGNNGSCVWKVVPEVKFDSYRIKFESLGTETNDGVFVYFGNSIEELEPQKVTEFGSWIPIPAPYVLITFYSNPSKFSSGFEASILGFRISEDGANLSPLWFENSTETFDFLASDKIIDHIGAQTPLMTSTDCGGILEVARGFPSTIRYPNGGNYTNLERCVWSISPKVKFASYWIKVQSFGMQTGSDGVRIYFWDSSAELQSQMIINFRTEFGSWISIPAPYVIITFCSDGVTVGGGFDASIVGLGSSLDSITFTPFWLTNPESFSFPGDPSSTGSKDEMISVVVQPPNAQSVNVSMSVPQIGNHTIKPYKLNCAHIFSSGSRLLWYKRKSESSSLATYELSTGNYYLFFMIFKSNSRYSGVRFTVSY